MKPEFFAVVWQDFGIALHLRCADADEARAKASAMNEKGAGKINARAVHLSSDDKLTYLELAQ